jgi:hypothetical protein
MSFSHDEWKAIGAVLSGVAQLGALLATGWYFLLKRSRGYHAPNLSLSIACERSPSKNAGLDWLSVQIILTKGDRAALSLRSAEGRITCGSHTQFFHFWGTAIAQKVPTNAVSVDWNATTGRPMNIIAGEATQFAKLLQVPVDEACQIDIAVLAEQPGDLNEEGNPRVGQWQVSAVSLPIPIEDGTSRSRAATTEPLTAPGERQVDPSAAAGSPRDRRFQSDEIKPA